MAVAVSVFADTAHPLFVDAEIARSIDPRSREAAALLLDEVVRGPRG